MYGFVYLTTNTINEKRYVGLCSHEKPILTDGNLYLGSGKILRSAIKKYGKDSFTRSILQVCNSREELHNAEIEWISNIGPEYNIDPGGFGGNSERMKEYWSTMTADERKQARNWNKDHSNHKNPVFEDAPGIQRQIWENRTIEERKQIGNKISKTKKSIGSGIGTKNSMHGRSAIKEQNLRWYTNGHDNKYITEGTEPAGFRNGRTNISGKIGRKKCAANN